MEMGGGGNGVEMEVFNVLQKCFCEVCSVTNPLGIVYIL